MEIVSAFTWVMMRGCVYLCKQICQAIHTSCNPVPPVPCHVPSTLPCFNRGELPAPRPSQPHSPKAELSDRPGLGSSFGAKAPQPLHVMELIDCYCASIEREKGRQKGGQKIGKSSLHRDHEGRGCFLEPTCSLALSRSSMSGSREERPW
jgi:hypothetical protein